MKNKYLLLYLFIFIVFFTKGVYSQTSISGIINQYTVIDSIYPTKDTIEVRNPSLYFVDDTVMVYQVKGATVRTDTSDDSRTNFGTFNANSAKNSGKYEIIRIEKIVGNKVILKGNLNNDYDIEGIVQLISVPSYINVSVDGELTCKSWEDTTGGILVFMVSDTLFLNADINVAGKGFRGAEPFLSDGTCAITDSVLYKSYYFHENADTISAGYKGEGVVKIDPVYRKGLGRWANGGGGGNGRFTGGGGGGNAGNGGTGGAEDTTICGGVAWPYDNWKGLGGNDGYGFEGIIGTINDSTIFLGGGGGSGTEMSEDKATKGGNGGGIVIIVATNIKTSGRQIMANGDSVSVVVSDIPDNVATESAGGGGAGGVVVFDVDSIIGDLSITVEGGGGGFVESLGEAGPGGGGGGGVIFWKELQPNNISLVKTSGGGAGGYVMGIGIQYYASAGNPGSKRNYVKTPLTGFLYNSIISNQDVCWGFNSKLLEGSSLRGGYGSDSYSYQWQERKDGDDWSDISGATQEDYQALNLKDTIYYRRVAYSTITTDTITDYGNDIKIIVHDTIQNNNIFTDSLIACINNLGDTITGTKVVLGGDYENYNYYWQISPDSVSWSNFTSSDINDTIFLPGTISDTSYVRRIVESGACRDTVVPVKIIGLPQIGNNIITAVDEICYDVNPDEIIGTLPVDGLGVGTYSYQWEKRTNSSGWITIGGDQLNYDPSNLIDTTYYKRTVYSYDCVDESEVDTIIVLDSIKNNIILTSVLARNCYNTQKQIDATVPIGGRNIYEYQWWESSDELSWTIITDALDTNYLSYNLTDKTYFRRFVKSGACKDISDNIEVTIDSLPVAKYTGFIDTTICSELPIDLEFNVTNGSYDYTLTYNDGEKDSTIIDFIEGVNIVTISPTTLQESKIFTYTIVSVEDQNGCFATDITGFGELTVYGNPIVDAGIDVDSCVLDYNLSATSSIESAVGFWRQLPDTESQPFDDMYSRRTGFTVDSGDVYKCIWEETNWECSSSDSVILTLYSKVDSVNIGSDTTLRNIYEYTLHGTYINHDKKLVEDGIVDLETTWQIISGSGVIFDVNDSITSITDLSYSDNNGIVIRWQVEKGVCVEAATVILKLEEEIFQPTGFTPNGDGINDYLKFYDVEGDKNELVIYNRWGAEVDRITNFSNEPGWNGKNSRGNDFPEDTYYYILTYLSKKSNLLKTDNGFFVIKRH